MNRRVSVRVFIAGGIGHRFQRPVQIWPGNNLLDELRHCPIAGELAYKVEGILALAPVLRNCTINSRATASAVDGPQST